MAVAVYYYGTEKHVVRVGFAGQRPLVYAIYQYNNQDELPLIPGHTYRTITRGQFDWIKDHLKCDVSFISGEYPDRVGNLECRTHGCHYQLFTDDPIITDLWEERHI